MGGKVFCPQLYIRGNGKRFAKPIVCLPPKAAQVPLPGHHASLFWTGIPRTPRFCSPQGEEKGEEKHLLGFFAKKATHRPPTPPPVYFVNPPPTRKTKKQCPGGGFPLGKLPKGGGFGNPSPFPPNPPPGAPKHKLQNFL